MLTMTKIDNFQQPHYELHHRYLFRENLDMKNTFFYIHGKGFYRQFKEEADLWEYGLTEISDEEADIVRENGWEKTSSVGSPISIGSILWEN